MNYLGEWGEIYACRYLRDRRVEILCSNYRCRFGEADIIGIDKNILIFVEVKARSSGSIAAPAEFVDEAKQRKLSATANHFLSRNKFDMPVRFDVAEVYFSQKDNYKDYKINYIKDAFRV